MSVNFWELPPHYCSVGLGCPSARRWRPFVSRASGAQIVMEQKTYRFAEFCRRFGISKLSFYREVRAGLFEAAEKGLVELDEKRVARLGCHKQATEKLITEITTLKRKPLSYRNSCPLLLKKFNSEN